jgi:DNA-binding PadR family transcriptional regulator
MTQPVPDAVLLGLIQHQPAHGYDLLSRFQSRAHLGRIWTLSTSQLYAVLKRLESEGALTGRRVQAPHAPARTDYHITPSGQKRLRAWLAEAEPSTSIHQIRVLFLSRLYIASLLGLPTEGILARQRAACESQRQRLTRQAAQTDSPIERLTLSFVINQLAACLAWLADCESALPLALPEDTTPRSPSERSRT